MTIKNVETMDAQPFEPYGIAKDVRADKTKYTLADGTEVIENKPEEYVTLTGAEKELFEKFLADVTESASLPAWKQASEAIHKLDKTAGDIPLPTTDKGMVALLDQLIKTVATAQNIPYGTAVQMVAKEYPNLIPLMNKG